MTLELVREETYTRIAKLVSPKIELFWNPATNGGHVWFHPEDAIMVNGEYKGTEPSDLLKTFSVDFANISDRVFTVTLPDGSSAHVPFMLLMLTIKTAFEELANEEQQRLIDEAIEMARIAEEVAAKEALEAAAESGEQPMGAARPALVNLPEPIADEDLPPTPAPPKPKRKK